MVCSALPGQHMTGVMQFLGDDVTYASGGDSKTFL
jgi:hypothetical protein